MKRISNTEKKYFEKVSVIIQTENFPKTCESCGKIYSNELEYNKKTAELDCSRTTIHKKGIVSLSEREVIFCRNCKCGNLLSLVLTPPSWTPVADAGFKMYLAEKSQVFIEDGFKKDVAWRMALIEFRDRYNRYLEAHHH